MSYFKINPDSIGQVYSGAPGCACGCRGNYSVRPHVIKQIVGKIAEAVKYGATPDIFISPSGSHIAVQTETRAYTAYFAAVAAVAFEDEGAA